MKGCPGSGIVLDAPAGTTHLTCPHCGRRVQVRYTDVYKFDGAPRWVLRGHQVTNNSAKVGAP